MTTLFNRVLVKFNSELKGKTYVCTKEEPSALDIAYYNEIITVIQIVKAPESF